MARRKPFFRDGDGGAIVTFESSLPQYSYAEFDAQGNVVGTVEKKVVSDRAICGRLSLSFGRPVPGSAAWLLGCLR